MGKGYFKNNPQVYTTQESIKEIKSNPWVNTTQEGIEGIESNPQVNTLPKIVLKRIKLTIKTIR